MGLVFIGFIPVMFMPENGRMVRVMDVVFILVKMGVDMLESLNGVLNMALVITISGLFFHFLLFNYCSDQGFKYAALLSLRNFRDFGYML